MKLCEAFRKEWEASWIITEEHRTTSLRAEINYLCRYKHKTLNPESEMAYFLAWYEEACTVTVTMLIKKYGVTQEAIMKAVADGFVKCGSYNNAMTRAGLALTDPVHLTAKGKKALCNAFPTWKP